MKSVNKFCRFYVHRLLLTTAVCEAYATMATIMVYVVYWLITHNTEMLQDRICCNVICFECIFSLCIYDWLYVKLREVLAILERQKWVFWYAYIYMYIKYCELKFIPNEVWKLFLMACLRLFSEDWFFLIIDENFA